MDRATEQMIPHREPLSVPPGNHEPAETRFVEMVFPEQANHYGTLFGGNALSLMGKAAFVAASRHVRCAVVMGTCDKVEFHHPVAVGELVEIAAHVSRVGRASMTVEVEVTAETLVSGARRPAMSGRFEMVVVDISGRPIPISIPESPIPKEV